MARIDTLFMTKTVKKTLGRKKSESHLEKWVAFEKMGHIRKMGYL